MANNAKTQKKNVKKENKKEIENTKTIVKEVKEEVKKEKVEKPKKKRDTEKLNNFLKKVDDNRWPIILFVIGFLVATLIFRCLFWPDRIATLADGTQPVATLTDETITADMLYENMKKTYSVDAFLKTIDDIILSKKYPSTTEMETDVKNTAEYYYSMYEQNYGYTKENFLTQYGFASEDDFIDSLRLDYRRNKYYEEYAVSLVTDKDIEKYYKDDVFGDVDSKHILVSTKDDGLSDEEAKKVANEIIDKLNKGTSWEDVIKEYKDKEEYKDAIISEELGYNAFNASLESAYLKECKELAVNSYSKTPVLTSYGYHIVYKIAQKEKPALDDVKDDVIEVLAKEKKSADSNLYYKSLIKMRTDAGLEFSDTKYKEAYEKLMSQYK